MSATPFLEGFDSYQYIKVITQDVHTPKIQVIKSKRAIIRATLAEVKKDTSKAIVLMQCSKRIEQLKQALELNGFRVATIKRDGELNNKTYDYLMKEECLPDDIDVLICTSKIATGVNIFAKEKTRMIYAEIVVIDNKPVFNIRLCKQFFARVRNTEMAEYIAITLHSEHEKKPVNSSGFYRVSKANYQKRAKELNDNPDLPLEVIRNDFSEYIEMYAREKDGTLSVNELAIMYLVLSKEIRNGNPDDLIKESVIFENVATEDKQALAQAAADFRKVQVKTEGEIFELFTTDRQNLAGSIYKKTKDKKLKDFLATQYNAKYYQHHSNIILSTPQLVETAEQAFKRDQRTAGLKIKVDDRQKLIFSPEKRMLTTNAVFGRTCNTLAVHLALQGIYTSELDKNQVKQYRNIEKALLLAFQKHDRLSAGDILKIVNKHFTTFKTKTKTTQIAEIFFELERRKSGDEQFYYFKKGLNLNSIACFLGIGSEQFSPIYKEKETTKSVQQDCPENTPDWILTRGEEPPF